MNTQHHVFRATLAGQRIVSSEIIHPDGVPRVGALTQCTVKGCELRKINKLARRFNLDPSDVWCRLNDDEVLVAHGLEHHNVNGDWMIDHKVCPCEWPSIRDQLVVQLVAQLGYHVDKYVEDRRAPVAWTVDVDFTIVRVRMPGRHSYWWTAAILGTHQNETSADLGQHEDHAPAGWSEALGSKIDRCDDAIKQARNDKLFAVLQYAAGVLLDKYPAATTMVFKPSPSSNNWYIHRIMSPAWPTRGIRITNEVEIIAVRQVEVDGVKYYEIDGANDFPPDFLDEAARRGILLNPHHPGDSDLQFDLRKLDPR